LLVKMGVGKYRRFVFWRREALKRWRIRKIDVYIYLY